MKLYFYKTGGIEFHVVCAADVSHALALLYKHLMNLWGVKEALTLMKIGELMYATSTDREERGYLATLYIDEDGVDVKDYSGVSKDFLKSLSN